MTEEGRIEYMIQWDSSEINKNINEIVTIITTINDIVLIIITAINDIVLIITIISLLYIYHE